MTRAPLSVCAGVCVVHVHMCVCVCDYLACSFNVGDYCGYVALDYWDYLMILRIIISVITLIEFQCDASSDLDNAQDNLEYT